MKKIFTLAILGLFACNSFECSALKDKFKATVTNAKTKMKNTWNNSWTKAAVTDISATNKKNKAKLGNAFKKLGNKIAGTTE